MVTNIEDVRCKMRVTHLAHWGLISLVWFGDLAPKGTRLQAPYSFLSLLNKVPKEYWIVVGMNISRVNIVPFRGHFDSSKNLNNFGGIKLFSVFFCPKSRFCRQILISSSGWQFCRLETVGDHMKKGKFKRVGIREELHQQMKALGAMKRSESATTHQ
ncbi:hypothetical protein GM415_08935 [Pseudodesulfovibrio cashew]|uniref:Uncharacterized protein n=1 Tax=Pseudodesulfovibrio cashew TaxID=2678688 RepID=A0A6I6JBU4_9BACT|nr:hypothetical protein [Pseudodesulfovibrio cashew]QGY40246.1 hypothetical protein GM415_08935 [Pseudodesulfovibrio cashew]